MYGFMLNTLCALRVLGLKRTAVRVAYWMESHARDIYHSKMFDAAQHYLHCEKTGFPECSECYLPILSETEKLHELCREEIERQLDMEIRAQEEYEQMAAEFAMERARFEIEEILDEFCGHYGCWEPRVELFCDEHEPKCSNCGDYESACQGTCADYPEDEDYVSSQEVYNRAYAVLGNHELAREAASQYPGDFI